MIFCQNKKLLKAQDLVLLFVQKKLFFFCFGHGPWGPHFCAQVGLKNKIFQRFQQIFFRTTGFQLKFLTLNEFPNILHWKPVFSYFTWGLPFKARSSDCKTSCGNLWLLQLEMPKFKDIRVKFLPILGQIIII